VPATVKRNESERLVAVISSRIAARTEGGRFYPARLSPADRSELRSTLHRLHNELRVSLLEISRMLGRSQYFLWRLFANLEIPRRGVAEANALSAPIRTRRKRTPFSGPDSERAYLLGFTCGDLTAWQVSGTSVMVSSTTTHPAFVELFKRMFGGHGPLYCYPMREAAKGYRWKVATRLDNSFRFLFAPRADGLDWASTNRELFMEWLAGFTDSDGSIHVARALEGVRIRLLLYNTDLALLKSLKQILERFGFGPNGPYVTMPKGTVTPYARYTKDLWSLPLQRSWEAQKLLMELPLRHREKQGSKAIALSVRKGDRWKLLGPLVREARRKVEEEVQMFRKEAEIEYEKRHGTSFASD